MAGARLPQPLERASSKVANHAFYEVPFPLIRAGTRTEIRQPPATAGEPGSRRERAGHDSARPGTRLESD
jgi:hypothetical protein